MATFAINPNSEDVVLHKDVGIFPSSQSKFTVYNIGRTEVYAETLYGIKIKWLGVVSGMTVKPGEKKVLPNYGKLYFVLGLKIYNKTNIRAVIYASQEYQFNDIAIAHTGNQPFDINYNDILKSLIALTVKLIPQVGSTISELIKAFWPDGKPNVWDQIKDKLETLVDTKIVDAINGLLSGDLAYFQERIRVLSEKLESGKPAAFTYMNIAEDLVGLVKKFSFSPQHSDYQKINFYLLPLYSILILMEINFYNVGLQQTQTIGLTDDNISDIKGYANRLITSANKYITDMFKERVDDAYNTSHPQALFNTMMSVRTYIAVNGLEFIPVWNSILAGKNPTGVYNDTISYSQTYGRINAEITKEAIPEVLPSPLTPKLVNGQRSKLMSIDVYIWRINRGAGPPKIGGMKLMFDNGDIYIMGTTSSEVSKVPFKGALLNKLKVSGIRALDKLTFYFSDGREISVGTDSRFSSVFELKRHHIVSMYLNSDDRYLAGQAANLAVSYQLTPN